jgi:hypothetical protein
MRVNICGYQKFHIALLDCSDGFVDHDVGGLKSVLYSFGSEMSNSLLTYCSMSFDIVGR